MNVDKPSTVGTHVVLSTQPVCIGKCQKDLLGNLDDQPSASRPQDIRQGTRELLKSRVHYHINESDYAAMLMT